MYVIKCAERRENRKNLRPVRTIERCIAPAIASGSLSVRAECNRNKRRVRWKASKPVPALRTYIRTYVRIPAARVESERNRGVYERGVAYLHSRGNARTWHRHERILSSAPGNTHATRTQIYTHARRYAHTHADVGPFIYVLAVTPAIRSVTIMPSYFIPQHPARLELLLPFCLLRFVLACSYAYSYSRVLIILQLFIRLHTVYHRVS